MSFRFVRGVIGDEKDKRERCQLDRMEDCYQLNGEARPGKDVAEFVYLISTE